MADFGGHIVLHCHVLSQGDDGAMAWVNVINGPTINRNLINPITSPMAAPT